MANIAPRTTFGGRPVAWMFSLVFTDAEISGVGTVYPFNHLQTLTPTFASSESASSTTEYIEEPAADGITFRTPKIGEMRNALTGATEGEGGSGGGGIADKVSVVSLATDPLLDVNVIKGMRGGPVCIIIPHGKNYVNGAPGTQGYYVLLGKITSISGPEFSGNSQSKMTVEITGGTPYVSVSGIQTEIAAAVLAAIKPAGSDTGGAGVPAPSLAGIDPIPLLGGEIVII